MSESREYPKRIWAGHLGGGRRIWKPELMHESEKAFACDYIRADIADEMLKALKGALVVIKMMERPENCGETVDRALDRRIEAAEAAIAKAEALQ